MPSNEIFAVTYSPAMAYEAYVEACKNVGNFPTTPWDKLTEWEREGWKAAIKPIVLSTIGQFQTVFLQKDAAYKERNQLVCALSKLLPSHLLYHDTEDQTWDKEWHWIVCIHGPAGQMTWHIHDNELSMFGHIKNLHQSDLVMRMPDGHLEYGSCNGWDGHTTDEKYNRLAQVGV